MSGPRIVGLFLSVVLLSLAAASGYFGYRLWREREPSAAQGPAPAAPDHAAMGRAPMPPSEGAAAPAGTSGQAIAYAPVSLTPDQQHLIGVTTGRAESRSLEKTIRAVGRVDVDETRVAHVHTKVSGWAEEVFVNYTFQHVLQGDPLFTIYSPELVATQEELLLALRARDSLGKSAFPGVARGTESLLDATRRRLSLWDISPEQIAEIERSGQVQRTITIHSPILGHVTERNVFPSTYVTPEMDLYTIVDHSQVWINAEIYQSEIGFVRVGQPAVATTNAYPGREFAGRVNYVFPHMEHETRTLKVRLEFPNPDLELKPEMYTNVELKIPLGRRLVVPESAVVDTGTRQIVFVVQAPGSYLPRDVRTGLRENGLAEILQGLRAGEEVVTSANFLIDSESQLRAALGSMTMGTGVTEMAGRPATTPAGGVPAGPQAQIQFRSDPSPPRTRGTNLFVTLTDAAGNPIADAAVRVVFFMPAMPAMGMAAIRNEASLNPSGGGTYQGQITLPSPGTWQVTVTAERGGTLLGTQQFSVTAQP